MTYNKKNVIPVDYRFFWEAHNKEWYERPATEAEADMDNAHEKGEGRPQHAWICSDRDVWYKNPHYKGKPVPHPETIS